MTNIFGNLVSAPIAPRPDVTLAWLANRVYGDRARVVCAVEEEVDGEITDHSSPWRPGDVRLRVDLCELRGSRRQHRLDTMITGEMIEMSVVDAVRYCWEKIHARLERDLGPSVSWAEFLASRPVQLVHGSSFAHDPPENRRCVTHRPDLLCACGKFIVAWDGRLPA